MLTGLGAGIKDWAASAPTTPKSTDWARSRGSFSFITLAIAEMNDSSEIWGPRILREPTTRRGLNCGYAGLAVISATGIALRT